MTMARIQLMKRMHKARMTIRLRILGLLVVAFIATLPGLSLAEERSELSAGVTAHAYYGNGVPDEAGWQRPGVLADAVQELLRITESAIQPATSNEIGDVRELCVRGDEFVSIIDLERVLEFDADQ